MYPVGCYSVFPFVQMLFPDSSILIVLGPGGVGKTTVAAALGLAAAQSGTQTGVLTIDPAQRLRDVLEIRTLGAEPRRLSVSRLRAAGLDTKLPFAALALDVKHAWEELLTRIIADPERRARIVQNPFYRELSGGYAGAENYAALDRLLSLHESRRFTVLVVDTPPAQHIFDFFKAPEHLMNLLDSPAARWLGRLNQTSRLPGLRVANRLGRTVLEQLEKAAGQHIFSSIIDFLEAAADSRRAISERVRKASALLRSPQTSFVIVTSTALDRLDEALRLVECMRRDNYRVSGIVLNRAANALLGAVQPLALRKARDTIAGFNRVGIAASEDKFAAMLSMLDTTLAARQDLLIRLKKFAEQLGPQTPVVEVPDFEHAVTHLDHLLRIADILGSGAKPSGISSVLSALSKPGVLTP